MNDIPNHIIFEGLAGSHSYGTNLPTSDLDTRGLFVTDLVNLRTPFNSYMAEWSDPEKEDSKLYELNKFMKLYLDGNPNIIELLWVDDTAIMVNSPAYQLLRQYRQKLLSSKVAFTFSGYAAAQLKRIRGHNKWITNPQPEEPPKPQDYVKMVRWFGDEKMLKVSLSKWNTDHRLVPFGNDLYGVYPASGYSLFSKNGHVNTQFDGDSSDYKLPIMMVQFHKHEYKADKEKHANYWEWKSNRNEKRSLLEEQFGYDCYSDDTEFLTNDGWKRFDDVGDNDLIATFNRFSHRVEYQSPTERIESLYTGNMYHFTGHHTDCLVTANHHMFIRPFSRAAEREGAWDFSRAGELPETFDMMTYVEPKRNRNFIPKGCPVNVLNEITLLDFLRLIGWYVSDGTMSFYDTDRVKHMRISQSKLQSKLTQTLTKQINAGKIKCNHYLYEAKGIANHPENIWTFPQEISQTIFESCGHGSKTKRLPQWCFFLTKREMTTLLVALLQGDGSKRNHQEHTYVYYTINKDLADDVQRLALMCGFETSLYGPYEDDMCQVYINMRPKFRRTARRRVSKNPVKNKRIVCFMVPNLTLITRRNGQVGFHGNTKHAMHLVRLMRMGEEILTTGQVNVLRPDAEELLDIRNGAWSYDELIEYATEKDDLIRNKLYKKTDLPKKPNVKLARNVVVDVQNLVWSGEDICEKQVG